MKYLNKVFLILIIGFTFAFLVNSKTYSQLAMVNHDLGKINQKWYGTLDWNAGRVFYPAGSYKNRFSANEYFWVVSQSIIKSAGDSPTPNAFWTRYTPGAEHISEELMIYKKHSPPSIICDGIELSPPFTGTVDPTIDSDSYWTTKVRFWTVLAGYMRIKTRAYVNENHDDYILYDSNIELGLDLDGDGVDDMPEQTVNIMFSHSRHLSANQRAFAAYGTEHWYRNINWRHAEYFPVTLASGAPRDRLVISLSHHADRVDVRRPYGWSSQGVQGELDDAGAPMGPESGAITINNSELIAPQYAGYATLHADKSVNDTSDDTNMPIATGKLIPWGFMDDHSDVWGWMTSGWDIREDKIGFDDPYRYSYIMPHQLQKWGPYAMKKGESFSIIHATGIGSVGNDLAREKGAEFMKWYRDGEGTFDNAAKNAFLAQGLDSLTQNINRAYWNYYVKNYDIPDPLGAPDIKATSGPDMNIIEWGYPDASMFNDPDTGVEDFKEWRVYRKKGNLLVNHPSDLGYFKYELIGTFPKGTTKLEDTGVIRGEAYHYAVTAVDDGSQNTGGLFPGQPLESSFYANRTLAAQTPFKPGLETSEEVLIVPNPYSISTGIENAMNYTGYTNDIHFINLPSYCTLKIYTATGDLIKTIEHTSGSGDEIWRDMRTDSNQAPVSGVYILAVENAKTLDKNPLPKKFFKFVIVR